MKYFAAIMAAIFGLIAIILFTVYYAIVIGIISPLEIPIVLEGTLEYSDIKQQLIAQDIITIIIIIVCIIAACYFYYHYHRLNKKKKDIYDKDSIKPPLVLYLRSFIDDKTTRKLVAFNDIRSEEEVLVNIMSDIAPVYAIGDPRDKKMPIGASRIYVDDEHWKSTVIELMNKAAIVILRLGKTDSFWWEVETAVKNIPLEKVLFVIPQSKTFSNVATLYKILLEHNIDIKHLDVAVEKKKQGSVSSFLYFDKDGQAFTNEVRVPRFTRLVLSYENILRNSLAGFREKCGFKTKQKHTFIWARLFQILLIAFIIFIGVSQLFTHLTSLKYQMPYEFVEKCVKSPDFVNKYSNEINSTNLVFGLEESQKGLVGLDDDNFKLWFLIEARTIQSMSYDEYKQLYAAHQNMLLMVKKYLPDHYDSYVIILYQAAIIALQNPTEIEELTQLYNHNIDAMPQWVYDLANAEDMPDDDYEYMLEYINIVEQHLNDDDFVNVMKTIQSQ